ncbi:hypothetical protein KAR91_08415 [Candidatus Pacearchaeota archaeon]|nr:hypothetical protein [Candidatus Pacearchaeota archaeon]
MGRTKQRQEECKFEKQQEHRGDRRRGESVIQDGLDAYYAQEKGEEKEPKRREARLPKPRRIKVTI